MTLLRVEYDKQEQLKKTFQLSHLSESAGFDGSQCEY